jgi:hypothetical protein
MSSVEVYNNANEALITLSNLWQTMLQIIQAVSNASASSLTVEPDLVQLQKSRKDYEQLVTSLNATITWLEANKLAESNDKSDLEELTNSLEEHAELQKVKVCKRN